MNKSRVFWSLAALAGILIVPATSAISAQLSLGQIDTSAASSLRLVQSGGGAMTGGRTGVGVLPSDPPPGGGGGGGRGNGGWSGNPNYGGPGIRPGRGGGDYARGGDWNGGRGHHRGHRNRYFVGSPYYYDDYGYDDNVEYRGYSGGDGGDEECAARYRSYDPATGTFLGYDGLRHPCPYLE